MPPKLLTAAKRARDTQAQRDEAELVASRQLPLWGDAKRGLPNALARSALFNARRNTDDGQNEGREYLKNALIASLSNYDITYRGEELRQDDASVFMQLLHLARQQPVGERVYFTAYSMLKSLGWSINGTNYKRLEESILRLKSNSVTVLYRDGDSSRKKYGKSLLRAFYSKEDLGEVSGTHWCVEFEPDILALFGDDAYTLVEWQERRRIGSRSTLALWLHSFLASHRNPIPMSVEKYRELSESSCKALFHFRAQLRQALERLKAIGFIEHHNINDRDMVEIRLVPREVRVQQARMLAEA